MENKMSDTEATARAILDAKVPNDTCFIGAELSVQMVQTIVRDYLDMREMLGELDELRLKNESYIAIDQEGYSYGKSWQDYLHHSGIADSPLVAYRELKKL